MMLLAAVLATLGAYHLYSAIALGRTRLRLPSFARASERSNEWLTQAGLIGVRAGQLVAVEVVVFAGVTAVTWIMFGAALPALLAGLFGSIAILASFRSRRRGLRDEARDAWPYVIEEMRLLTGAVGRSVPVAMLEAGRKSPTAPMRAAFEEAQREWLLTTDFARSTQSVKNALADATADVVCETLLIAHEVGGSDLDRRLLALVEDRRVDLRNRHEAVSRQAGVRFARWFVLAVPLGMALVGLSIGDGHAAYRSTAGQIAVAIGISLVACCWMWASRIMRLPEAQRVFRS